MRVQGAQRESARCTVRKVRKQDGDGGWNTTKRDERCVRVGGGNVKLFRRRLIPARNEAGDIEDE